MYLSKQSEGFLIEKIINKTGHRVSSLEFKNVGGGSINNTYKITTNQQQNFFLKTNTVDRFPDLFEKEKNSLILLSGFDCINIPSVIFCAKDEEVQFLLLEWISSGIKTENFWKQFGENLARLHRCSDGQFGLAYDNYMGALPQSNHQCSEWVSFFINYRLQPQIQLAVKQNQLPVKYADLFEPLFKRLDSIFNTEKPSLLHGDLWSGNFMCNEKSEPVLIDPAVYFGHRSVDIGMTTLFGGFDKLFYSSYNYHYPFPPNYQEQWEVCNLYPLLIHLNLFGQSYLHDIVSTLRKYE